MVDPISVAAVTAVLGAVGAGAANEAGKRAWESAGALVRRVAGREVSAPAGAGEREAVARLLVDAAGRDSAHARALLAWMRSSPGPVGAGTGARPRELPASVRFFTDRRDALRALSREASRKADGRPRVVQLYGPEGVGSSTLACHWGHRESRRFPDGQLYVDLAGGGALGSVRDTATAARLLLRQLGVEERDVPSSAEERAGLFRALVADRRLLVVLDHAYSAAQVRPLLTSYGGVFTVVVAHRPLAGLDALSVPVGPLADRDAVRLLTDLAGKPAVAAAKAALPSVLARCGGYPFALRAEAPRLATAPSSPSSLEGSVHSDDHADDPVRAAAAGLYRQLEPDAARVFRLQALWPWPAFGAAVTAHTAGTGKEEAARILEDLAARQLLEPVSEGRYRYRPSVRRFAERAAAEEESVAACAAALASAVRWYLHFAVRADRAALPQRWTLGPLYRTLPPGPYATVGEAVAALAAERGNLVQAVLAAEESGDPESVRQLGEALWAVQLKAGAADELLPALRAAARAAGALHPGTEITGRARVQLGLALSELGRDEEAESELRAAARAEAEAGHARGRATALESLGLLRLRQWRHQDAYGLFEEADAALLTIGPEGRGAGDVPRARALLERHRGRALRGLGRRAEAVARLETALAFFRDTGEDYNTARTLTDLAETHLDAEERGAALPLLDEAAALLAGEDAGHHLERLRGLREIAAGRAGSAG